MSDEVRCLACDNVVADHHQAIDCDSCGGWQHRGCETEANEIPNQVQLVKEGKLKRYQRKQVRKLQGRLMKQWEDYNEKKITTGQLLKKCSGDYSAGQVLARKAEHASDIISDGEYGRGCRRIKRVKILNHQILHLGQTKEAYLSHQKYSLRRPGIF
ncbi:hypothetical protein Pmani_001975 [Petrolisthes manimaculis]|uniref:Uncharacterized protein n=1 Tax=Petrolisthes manimaculis TaxID=1843537 RepID=A0AAE1QL98_9EUCA|nr:hypothetical protein Pmani_001975 [Petrolisthes manimaculis]